MVRKKKRTKAVVALLAWVCILGGTTLAMTDGPSPAVTAVAPDAEGTPLAQAAQEVQVNVTPEEAVTSIGRAPECEFAPMSIGMSMPGGGRGPTDHGWGEDASNNQCVDFVLNTPGTLTQHGATGASAFLGAGDFGPEQTYAFMYVGDSANNLYTMSTSTGATTLIGSATLQGAETYTGFAWDDSTQTMYATATDITVSGLYTVNLSTGAATYVGNMASPGIIALAVDCFGQLYAYDIVNDDFGSVNNTTGAYTTIGPLGFNANFGQGMDFDDDDGQLYMAAFNYTSFAAELRIVNTSDGSSTLVGALGTPGTSQLGFMGIDQACGPYVPTYGACCDDCTGDCIDGVEQLDCETPKRFAANRSCDGTYTYPGEPFPWPEMDPPCGPTGACCDAALNCIDTCEECVCYAQGGVSWFEGEDCATFVCPDTCEHSITMWDSYGDGWNGCTIDVYVNGVLELPGVTLPSGAGPGYAYFDAATGDTIFVDFTSVSYPTEASYCVYDVNGLELGCATGGYNPGDGDLTVTGNCELPTGACCFPDPAICYELTEAACLAMPDGFWLGMGTTCTPNCCPGNEPANDECVNATLVGPDPCETVNGTNECATVDCPGVLDWHATWWEIEMPYDINQLDISFCGNGFEINNVGIVYYNDCTDCSAYIVYDAIDWYSCADGVTSPQITWLNIAGPGTVFFPVYFNDGLSVDYMIEICVTELILPENDLCENAIPVDVPSVTPGTTTLATVDTGYECFGGTVTAPGVWYSVTGTGNTMTADLCNGATTWDTKMTVICPECVDFQCVGYNDDFCGVQSAITWCSQYGANYLILVHGYSSNSGDFELTVSDDDVQCVADVLCVGQGACCLPEPEGDDLCVIKTYEGCVAHDGEYQGDDSDCGLPAPLEEGRAEDPVSPPPAPDAALNWTFGDSSGGDRDDPTCPPGSLFDQPPTPATGGWTAAVSDLRTGSGYSELLRYEDFSGGGEICDIHFWGLTLSYPWAACTEDPMTFEVIFYNDDAGAPGTVACGPYALDISGTDTGESWAGFPLYEFAAVLDPCCSLASGWVSIQATSVGSPTDCWFLWASHGETGDGMSLLDDGGVVTTENFDLSLCLTGVPQYGACCDDCTGICVDDVASMDCPTRFAADTLCANLVPPCGILGACCVGLDCVATNLECDCDALGGTWYEGEDCATFVCPETCEHTIAMWDSYGDGWNGCTIDVYVNGLLVLGGVTLPSGSGPGYAYFVAAPCDEIFIDFTSVSYPTETSYCVYGGQGDELGCAQGGYNEGDGDLTVLGKCNGLPGACCFLDSSCADGMTQAACEAADGVFTQCVECATHDCPVYQGACCLIDGSCIITVESCCEFVYVNAGHDYDGDEFLGGGTDCGAPGDVSEQLAEWSVDVDSYGPGAPQSLDLSAYAGMTAQIEFRYYGDAWNWYVEVDNVEVTGAISEDFNAGIPGTWTVLDHTGVGCYWDTNTFWGRTNYAGGDGMCADADSDAAGSGAVPYDTSLLTPSFVVPDGATLDFILAYNYGGYGTYDVFEVNIVASGEAGENPCVVDTCLGVNRVHFDLKVHKDGTHHKSEIKGTFGPPEDAFDPDYVPVHFTVDDGAGHTLDLFIPVGSFEQEGDDPEKKKYRFKAKPPEWPYKIDFKFNFDKCDFKLKLDRFDDSVFNPNDIADGATLDIALRMCRSFGEEAVVVELDGHGNKLEYKAKPKKKCCPK